MHRPRPISPEIDVEAEDLAFGRKAIKILAAVNSALLVLLLLPAIGFPHSISEISMWFFLIQLIFLLVVFLPVFAYRLLRKRERPRLAASRALSWFIEAIGLAA